MSTVTLDVDFVVRQCSECGITYGKKMVQISRKSRRIHQRYPRTILGMLVLERDACQNEWYAEF
jgi:hypothetical protein